MIIIAVPGSSRGCAEIEDLRLDRPVQRVSLVAMREPRVAASAIAIITRAHSADTRCG